MPKTIEINKGILPFDDAPDTSRNNPDRKRWGKGESDFHISDEYDAPTEEPSLPAPPPPIKVTHKLANGVVLEADSIDELATKIEKALAPPPVTATWDETPVYTPMVFKPRELTVQEKVTLLNEWTKEPQKVIRAFQEAEFGASMQEIIQRFQQSEMIAMERAQEKVGVEFMMEVADSYNVSTENATKLTNYLKEKQKPITKNNLVRAFRELSATDPTMLRASQPVAEGEEMEPPAIVESNMGEPPVAAPPGVDIEKFKKMGVKEQKEFFAQLRRGGR